MLGISLQRVTYLLPLPTFSSPTRHKSRVLERSPLASGDILQLYSRHSTKNKERTLDWKSSYHFQHSLLSSKTQCDYKGTIYKMQQSKLLTLPPLTLSKPSNLATSRQAAVGGNFNILTCKYIAVLSDVE